MIDNYSLKIMEIQSVARRSREESKVLLEGEKLRNKDLTSRVARLEQDNENLQEQINTVQEENSSLRKDLSKRGDSLSGLNMQLLFLYFVVLFYNLIHVAYLHSTVKNQYPPIGSTLLVLYKFDHKNF